MAPESPQTLLESWLTSLIFSFRHSQTQTSDYKSEHSLFGSRLSTKTEQMTPQGMMLLKLQQADKHWASFPQPIPSFSGLVFDSSQKGRLLHFSQRNRLGGNKLCQSKPFMRHVCILFSCAPGRSLLRSHFFLYINKRLYYHLGLKHTPNLSINTFIVINYCVGGCF